MARRRFPLSRTSLSRTSLSRTSLSRTSLSRASLCALLGLAGLAGVAASGAVVTRAERRRQAYTPDEVRARLRERAAAADSRTS